MIVTRLSRFGNRSAIDWVLDQHKEKSPRDPTIREEFSTFRFADYKESCIALLDPFAQKMKHRHAELGSPLVTDVPAYGSAQSSKLENLARLHTLSQVQGDEYGVHRGDGAVEENWWSLAGSNR